LSQTAAALCIKQEVSYQMVLWNRSSCKDVCPLHHGFFYFI
jgi:hypothetical protein